MSPELVDRIRLGWAVLRESDDPRVEGIATQPIASAGAQSLLLGVDDEGSPCLLMPVDEHGQEEDIGVVTVRNRELSSSGYTRRFVVVTCREPALRDAFDHLLAAVIAAVDDDPARHPGAAAVGVLENWRTLLLTRDSTLGPARLAALLAELLMLEAIVERDPGRSLEVWTGPLESRHDLRRGSDAVEVKSTLAHTARQVTVHGIDQLEPPDGGTLTLAWYRFEVVPDGPLSVFDVADRLIGLGASSLELYRRLAAAGSPPSLMAPHDAVRFDVRDHQLFAVDDGFPRVVAAAFRDGVPRGVDDLSYRITLPPSETALGQDEAEGVLSRMAGVR